MQPNNDEQRSKGGQRNGSSSSLNGNGNQTFSKQSQPNRSLRQKLWSPGVSTPIPAHLSLAALRIALTAFFLGLLAGLVLPKGLGIIQAIFDKVKTTSTSTTNYSQLYFYLFAWSIFHLLEFVITAIYNPTRLFADSFLISNGITYHLAHLLGIIEFLLESQFHFSRGLKSFGWLNLLGLFLILFGQTIRSLAMVHCADNFSHEVATAKRNDHNLVTDGIYRICRHPSYVGFFYWAIGTQLMLFNPFSILVFIVVLWRFFRFRIKDEEIHLIKFFGDQYLQFRSNTPTLIPFIP